MPKIFPISRYDELVKATMDKVVELGVKKGGEYAGDVDRLANFRRNAEQWGLANMEQCWGVYAGKHWDAVTQYIRDLSSGVTRDRMESLEGRIDDIITYCLLFKAMLAERADEANRNRPFAGTVMPKATFSDTGE